MARRKRPWRAGTAGMAVLGLTLTACGGAPGDDTAYSGSNVKSSAKCGTVNLAVNPWVGYEANAAVIKYVGEHELGCKVVLKKLSIEEAWQGIGTGKVDAIVENWGQLSALVQRLSAFDVFYVGVHCPLEELERRERQRGDRRIGDARMDFQTVHTFSGYDFEVNSMDVPGHNAEKIIAAWKIRKASGVFQHLAESMAGH